MAQGLSADRHRLSRTLLVLAPREMDQTLCYHFIGVLSRPQSLSMSRADCRITGLSAASVSGILSAFHRLQYPLISFRTDVNA